MAEDNDRLRGGVKENVKFRVIGEGDQSMHGLDQEVVAELAASDTVVYSVNGDYQFVFFKFTFNPRQNAPILQRIVNQSLKSTLGKSTSLGASSSREDLMEELLDVDLELQDVQVAYSRSGVSSVFVPTYTIYHDSSAFCYLCTP